MKDKIIFEDGKIIGYYQSKQYKLDKKEEPVEEVKKKVPKIIERKPKKILSTFIKLSQKLALFRQKKKNDQKRSDDRIRIKNWGSKWWYVKPSKSWTR